MTQRLGVRLVLSLCAVCSGAAAPVLASNFGSINAGADVSWLTNNGVLNVIQRDLTATYATGLNDAIDNYNTVFSAAWTASTWADTTCSDLFADVCVFDSNYGPNGLLGWTECIGTTSGSHPSMECSLTRISINEYYWPPAQRTACHELGHSVGLRHSSESTSCMRSTNDGGTSAVLSTHDKVHLIDNY